MRKAEIIARILGAVAEYFGAFGEPIPMKVLAARFNKALQNEGGFPSAMEGLAQDGSVQIILLRTGGKQVYPMGVPVRKP